MDNEIALAKAGGDGYVGAKLNSLTDKVIIDKLIECSQAGVKVELVIRGISCLVAGVEGVSENIRIRSIVGRFLEHSRIYIFGAGVRKQVYISSADYMTRNTTRRVEVGVPLLDTKIKQRVLEYFDIQLHDNVKARVMNSDGIYERAVNSSAKCSAQEKFIAMAYEAAPAVTEQPAEPVKPAEPVQPEQTPKPAATITPPAQPEPQPEPVLESVPQQEPAQEQPATEAVSEQTVQPQTQSLKPTEPPVQQAAQPQPVQYAQPIDPPVPPQPQKKGLWARIKAFFGRK